MSLVHQIALTRLPGIGPHKARILLKHFGSAEAVFDLPERQLIETVRKGNPKTRNFSPAGILKDANEERAFVEKNRIKTFFCLDEDYPWRLNRCGDAPVLIYYRGNADLNASKVISVVGSRNATVYGKNLCISLLRELTAHQVLVVSGLAYGIDGTAHQEALANGLPTVGVLGHGLDRIYPAGHRRLARKMMDNGGLLTEFPSATIPDRENFPKRNRIIAGLADAVIVVEASQKGGALITANLANDYNRDVFAFPGRVTDEYSAGCHWLIRYHKAALICSAKDIEYLLKWEPDNISKDEKYNDLEKLSEDEAKIMKFLTDRGALSIEKLLFMTKLPQNRLVNSLLTLEMNGFLTKIPGNMYIKV